MVTGSLAHSELLYCFWSASGGTTSYVLLIKKKRKEIHTRLIMFMYVNIAIAKYSHERLKSK